MIGSGSPFGSAEAGAEIERAAATPRPAPATMNLPARRIRLLRKELERKELNMAG
jgi:hypothetical protein